MHNRSPGELRCIAANIGRVAIVILVLVLLGCDTPEQFAGLALLLTAVGNFLDPRGPASP